MSRKIKKTKGLAKGTSSAVFFSAMVHIVLLVIAGGVVVFTVVKKPETKFMPAPPVERPAKKVIPPRVKMQKTVKPSSPRRITSQRAQGMPAMQLPSLAGDMSEGLGGGVGGFEMMPSVSEMTMLGSKKSTAVGNDFVGTFYVFNWDQDGIQQGHMGGLFDKWGDFLSHVVTKFLDSGWNPYSLAEFYRAPQKLYTTQIMLPCMPSTYGPRAFGMDEIPEEGREIYNWGVHFKGKIKSKEGGRFRFWGYADEAMFVRFNGEIVLNACMPQHSPGWYAAWQSTEEDNYVYRLGRATASVGTWFDMEPDKVYEMEVFIGDFNPRTCAYYLMIQDESAEYYRRRSDDMPILPLFRTAEMSEQVKDAIMYSLPRNEVDLEGGPIFNVY